MQKKRVDNVIFLFDLSVYIDELSDCTVIKADFLAILKIAKPDFFV